MHSPETKLRALSFAIFLCATVLMTGEVLVMSAAAQDSEREVGDLGQVGNVSFPISCDPALQTEFDRGMALLHSFFYLEARNVFAEIAKQDPLKTASQVRTWLRDKKGQS